MKASITLCFILQVTFGFSFSDKQHPPPQKKITLIFHHQTGNQELVLGEPVKNILGDTINIQRFRYYVSNFSVVDDKGVSFKLPVDYFLVDEEDPASKKITLTIPDITITGIRFLLGVDSIRNVSGVQTGALDPLKGMFWTWNSGYIMAKLEGTCESLMSAGHYFTYHVGGFRTGINTARIIDLPLPKSVNQNEIHITADINKWFKGNSELKIKETPVCHSPGALAVRIADNYSMMFSVNTTR
jgi:hypothetical protein